MKGWSTEALGMCKQVTLNTEELPPPLPKKRIKVLSLFYGNVNVIYNDSETIATNKYEQAVHLSQLVVEGFSCFVTENHLFLLCMGGKYEPQPHGECFLLL